jgi:hypothetical protein
MDDVRIPERLVMDRATEFIGWHTEFVKQAARRMRIMLHTIEQAGKDTRIKIMRQSMKSAFYYD